jgi:hypothetical protein
MSDRTRRTFLKTTAGAAGLALARSLPASSEEGHPLPDTVAALVPRDHAGRQFVLYGDCCSGVAGSPNEKSHAAVNRLVRRIRPRPEFIAFPGDAVMGYTTDYQALRAQWDYWAGTEMSWLKGVGIPLYQSTSNHNTYDDGSEDVFRAVHPHLPRNGPGDQKGLAYFVRDGNLLYVSTHQPDRTRAYRQGMLIDTRWLDGVLAEHADARFKLVAGHYPVWPVNGYTQYPHWCFRPEERRPFWDVLVQRGVTAYLASHILAFDVQVHDGVPQVVSGGAGTLGRGPLALMPSRSEYLHAVQVALDGQGLRYQVLDVTGRVRESLRWPFELPPSREWQVLDQARCAAALAGAAGAGTIVAWRFRGRAHGGAGAEGQAAPAPAPRTLLCGWDAMEGVATVWVGCDGGPPRWTVRLVPQSGHGWQSWTGPVVQEGAAFDFQLALHPGMGPGGVLLREADGAPWESLPSTSSKGAEDLTWPRSWAVGEAQSGPTDWPFLGKDLRVNWTRCQVPAVV